VAELYQALSAAPLNAAAIARIRQTLGSSPVRRSSIDSSRDDFGMCRRHALGHGAPHPAQCLGRTCLGETFGGSPDVGPCDSAAGSGGLYCVEIDVEL
jgi:hypothetical protein